VSEAKSIHLPTRELSEGVLNTLKSLKAGDRIKVVQTVRVGAKTWPAEAVGVYRGINYLSTGVTTERVKEDDIVLPTVHFTKDNGELASICLDEKTTITKL
jgi:hypothetical protein